MPSDEITQDTMYAAQAEDDVGPGVAGEDPDDELGGHDPGDKARPDGAPSAAQEQAELAAEEDAALERVRRQREGG